MIELSKVEIEQVGGGFKCKTKQECGKIPSDITCYASQNTHIVTFGALLSYSIGYNVVECRVDDRYGRAKTVTRIMSRDGALRWMKKVVDSCCMVYFH
jgi:hypothetical protein